MVEVGNIAVFEQEQPVDLSVIQRQIIDRTEEVRTGDYERSLVSDIERFNEELAARVEVALSYRSGAAHKALRDLGLTDEDSNANFSWQNWYTETTPENLETEPIVERRIELEDQAAAYEPATGLSILRNTVRAQIRSQL